MLDELKDRIESFKQAAATATGEEIEAAKKVMNEIREWVNSAFDEIDNLISSGSQKSLSDTVFNLEKYLLSKCFIKSELNYKGSQEYGYIKDGIGFIDSQRTTTLAFSDFADNGTVFCIEIDFETIKGQAMAEMIITVLENEVKPKNE